jgi:hypothetical protein
MSLMLTGFGSDVSASYGPAVSGYVNDYVASVSSGVGTVSSASLGTPDATRVIAVAILTISGTTNITVDTVTVGGISAAAQKQSINNGANPHTHAEIWTASVPSGLAGNIVVTTSSSATSQVNVAVYALYTSSGTASFTGGGTTIGTNITSTVSLPVNGYAIVCGVDGTGAALSWTAGSISVDLASFGTTSKITAGHYTNAAGETNHSVTLHAASTDVMALAMASWSVNS